MTLLVKLKPGADANAVASAAGGDRGRAFAQIRTHEIRVPAASRDAALSGLARNPSVERAAATVRLTKASIPNDPSYDQQWALPRVAWDQAFGVVPISGSATIAVLDTGVDARHPDLSGRMVEGRSFTGGDPNVDPNGHGTALAGVAAASVNNATGIAGVAYSGASVASVQVLGTDGTGTDADVVAGVLWAADAGARVLLMGFSSPDHSGALADALAYAHGRGAVLVAATGNDSSSAPSFPAGMPNVIGVAASERDDSLARSSNTGSAAVAAPGVDVTTTQPGGGYRSVSGTSAAAAHAAGLAALLVASGRSASEASAQVRGATDPIAGASIGRLNVARALGAPVAPGVTPTPAPAPTPGPTPTYTAAGVGVSCSPTSLAPGGSTTCQATGSGGDSGSGKTVTFASAARGSAGFSPSNTCTTNSSSQCSVTFSPNLGGTDTITARIGNSSGTATLSVSCPTAGLCINGNATDWSSILLTFGDPSTDAGGGSGDITGVQMTADGTYLYVRWIENLTGNKNKIASDGFSISIDTAGGSTVNARGWVLVDSSGASTAQVERPLGTFTTIGVAQQSCSFSACTNGQTGISMEAAYPLSALGAAVNTTIAVQAETRSSASTSSSIKDCVPGASGGSCSGFFKINTSTGAMTVAAGNATTTVVTCDPSTVAPGGTTTCTAAVTDTSATGASNPTGTVSFSSAAAIGSCSLSPVSGSSPPRSTCSVTYTPSATGTQTIRAAYAGNTGTSQFQASEGTTTLTVASVPACTAPAVATHPVGLTRTVGQSATLSVAASGTAPLAYQWRKGGNAIAGATSSSFTISSVVSADAATYDVVVSNSCGSATSEPAALTVSKAGQATFTLVVPAGITYGSTGTASASGGSGSGAVSFSHGSSTGCTVDATTGVVTVTDASGTCAITATKAGDADYLAATDGPRPVVLSKANATVVLDGLSQTYDGTGKSASATTTPSGLPVDLTYNGTSTLPVSSGTYTVTATVRDGNYQGGTSGTMSIGKAQTTTVVSCGAGPFSYDGTAQRPCTAAVSGAGGLAETLAVSYSDNTNAGTATASASYAGGADHQGSAGSSEFVIQKAPLTVTARDQSRMYGASNPTLSDADATFGGFVNGEDKGVLTGALTFSFVDGGSNPVTTATLAGIYRVRPSGYVASNYQVQFVDGAFTVLNPVPVLSSTDPQTVSRGASADLTLAIAGSSFVPTSVARWNGVALVTTFVSSTSLTATVPAGYLTSVAAAYITVVNSAPGGGTSSTLPFFITEESTRVSSVAISSNMADGCETGSVTAATGGVTATGSGCGALAAAQYTSNPGSTPSFAASGAYFDVAVVPGSSLSSVSVALCGTSGSVAFWWDTSSSEWAAASPQSYNSSTGCVTVGPLTTSTTPSLSQLDGTFFALGTEATTTSVGLSSSSVPSGGSVNLSASLAPVSVAGYDVGGSVEFFINDTSVGSASVVVASDKSTARASLSGVAVALAPGTYTVTAKFTSSSIHFADSVGTRSLGVTKRSTTIVYTGPVSGVYSDTLNLSATLTDTATGQPLASRPVTFALGSQSASAVTSASGLAWSTLGINQSAGSSSIAASFAGDVLYEASSDSRVFTVTAECINPVTAYTYTGATVFWTTSSSSNTASLNLSATIKPCSDSSPSDFPGDIRTARVTFGIRNGGTFTPLVGATDLPVGLADPNNPLVGTATAIIQHNLGSKEIESLNLAVRVSGNFTWNNPADDVVISVAKPLSGNRIWGMGGRLPVANSVGLIAGAPSTEVTFGFDVKYNRSGTNPQGNVIFKLLSYRNPDGSPSTVLRTYQIKSNAISTLSIDLKTGVARFTSKATIVDITDPLNPISVDGGANLQLELQDNRSASTPDTLGISIHNSKSGGLWFSSSWNGARTVPVNTSGGDIRVS